MYHGSEDDRIYNEIKDDNNNNDKKESDWNSYNDENKIFFGDRGNEIVRKENRNYTEEYEDWDNQKEEITEELLSYSRKVNTSTNGIDQLDNNYNGNLKISNRMGSEENDLIYTNIENVQYFAEIVKNNIEMIEKNPDSNKNKYSFHAYV